MSIQKWNNIKHSKDKYKQNLIHYLGEAGWKIVQNMGGKKEKEKKKSDLSSVQYLESLFGSSKPIF